MSSFEVTNFELSNASKLGLTIKKSTNPNKKLDVYDKDNKFLFSIGNYLVPSYSDWYRTHGEAYANQRQKIYYMKNINLINKHDKNSLQFISSTILWGLRDDLKFIFLNYIYE